MKTKMMKMLALLLCMLLCFGNLALAADMMPPDGGMGEPPGGFGGGPPPGDAAPSEGAIIITDGSEDTASEYDPGAYSDKISVADGIVTIRDLELSSDDYTFNGVTVTGPDSLVRLEKSNIYLGVGKATDGSETGGNALNLDNGARVYVSDSELVVDGAARYVTAAYNDATLIVNNSRVESTGSNENTADVAEPFSNEALLISGTARANFSIGATKTYYFNSVCTAEGWAALSTDSATGNGLDLYAYNTEGIAENGGYSTYADTNCRVWLYGSRLTAAEIGCIISKSGQIHAYDAGAADEELLALNEGEAADCNTSIIGGRNAVMIHAPDMMGEGVRAADCGTFEAENTYLGTSGDLKSTKDYNDYSEAVGAYVDYVSGSVFLIRSTSANINLNKVQMESYNGTLIHTVLNADSMGNFLAAGDAEQVSPIAVSMTDMDVSGDIRHEDYQRIMNVDLENTTLSGNIVSGTMESWNETWKDYGEVNWVVDESFDASYGVNLTVGMDSVWNVTGESSLTSLTVAEGGTVNGEVTVDGEVVEPVPGETYTGVILVSGNYVPEEPEAVEEDEPVPEETAPVEETAPSGDTMEEAQPTEETTSAPAAETESKEPEAHSGSTTAVVIVIVVLVAVCAAAAVILIRKKKK